MHDAELHLSARKHRLDGLRASFQTIHASNQQVLRASILGSPLIIRAFEMTFFMMVSSIWTPELCWLEVLRGDEQW